jgi:putative hydrolase of the HAD superfamily
VETRAVDAATVVSFALGTHVAKCAARASPATTQMNPLDRSSPRNSARSSPRRRTAATGARAATASALRQNATANAGAIVNAISGADEETAMTATTSAATVSGPIGRIATHRASKMSVVDPTVFGRFFTEIKAIVTVARWFADPWSISRGSVTMSDQGLRYRAVLFDFFGTLTRPVRRGPAHARIAESLGCNPEDWIAELDRTFYQRASGRAGAPLEVLRDIAVRLGARPDRRRLRRAFVARVAAVRGDTVLRKESVPVLRALRRYGVRTALVSDCSYELPRFLHQLPVSRLLDAKVFSVDIGHCKPDAAMYLAACKRLRVRPQDCLYVGDGGSRELTGAAAVGMPAVRLASPDLSEHLIFQADTEWTGPTIASLTEVLPLLSSNAAAPDAATATAAEMLVPAYAGRAALISAYSHQRGA